MSDPTTSPSRRRGPHLLGALFMIVGSTIVLGSVVIMNELSVAPEPQEIVGSTAIEVAAPPPKPKPKVTQPKPKPPPKPTAPPPPSVAALTSGNASIAVDIPGLAFEDLGGASGDLLAGGEEVVHTSDTVDGAPQPVQQVPPKFPSRAKDRGIEGQVVLSLLINETGAIERMKVLESKPPGVFEESAKEAVRQWRFTPATYQGKPVKVWVNQPVTFRLK